ncbi:MAG: peptidase C1 [Bacteroidetes bacterium]|uniref:C1 family peptidase n=1 Tax=Phaeocystidibacter marisrubri TaxID=1577780 RepID=A0A6L3ZG84_9FLAO|nr:C1 family peptidase [Phaeocystidibacter marisrubri]KAB2817052.1 C1 family peptidase [Phaeocystidibacter marisrubri]TNE31496.1 MAG: peptidase C1 [Bacteroidota bacterium]GGH77051.1 hypothetical protein GCM10011318_26240 [Phaeocystidibacter marisrubri]
MRLHLILWTLIASLALSLSLSAQRANGLRFANQEDYVQIEKASIQLLKNVPSEFDLSKWFPKPGDQGSQASCVGWALAYGLKSYQEARRLQRPPTEQDHVFSPAFIYNQISDNCYSGSNLREALELMRRSGVAPMTSFPYDDEDCSKIPGNSIKVEAKAYVIGGWKRVEYRNEGQMKTFLVHGKPVVVGLETDTWFDNLSDGEVYRVSSNRYTGGHAVVVIGYDDRRGAYKILNSWGEDWGENGYGWIAYELFEKVVHEAYIVEDADVDRRPSKKHKKGGKPIDVGYIPEESKI